MAWGRPGLDPVTLRKQLAPSGPQPLISRSGELDSIPPRAFQGWPCRAPTGTVASQRAAGGLLNPWGSPRTLVTSMYHPPPGSGEGTTRWDWSPATFKDKDKILDWITLNFPSLKINQYIKYNCQVV